MTSAALSEARAMDAADRPVEAAAAYERAIQAGEGDLETYLDLAGLYLSSQDFGYQSYHRLPDAFVAQAAKRYFDVLDAAEAKFGSSCRIEFWRHYFRWRILGQYEREGPELRKIYEVSDVPEACLVVDRDDRGRLAQRLNRLYDLCEDGLTRRKRDLRSIAESRLRAEGLLRPRGGGDMGRN